MEATLRIQEVPCRKQITFDLSEDKLRESYPRTRMTLRPRHYKKAWTDIARFMALNEFEHRQYSVYASKMEMTAVEVNTLVVEMALRMPWICECVEAIDVTNIGEQHDLMDFVEDLKIELKQGKAV